MHTSAYRSWSPMIWMNFLWDTSHSIHSDIQSSHAPWTCSLCTVRTNLCYRTTFHVLIHQTCYSRFRPLFDNFHVNVDSIRFFSFRVPETRAALQNDFRLRTQGSLLWFAIPLLFITTAKCRKRLSIHRLHAFRHICIRDIQVWQACFSALPCVSAWY